MYLDVVKLRDKGAFHSGRNFHVTRHVGVGAYEIRCCQYPELVVLNVSKWDIVHAESRPVRALKRHLRNLNVLNI